MAVVAIFASCTLQKLVAWGNQSYGASYDSSVFKPTSDYQGDLSLRLAKEEQDIITIRVVSPASIDDKASRDDYFESARNEFESKFVKILNSKSGKLDQKGITTYTLDVTAEKEESGKLYTGQLRFLIKNNALMVVEAIADSETWKENLESIFEVMESALLKE